MKIINHITILSVRPQEPSKNTGPSAKKPSYLSDDAVYITTQAEHDEQLQLYGPPPQLDLNSDDAHNDDFIEAEFEESKTEETPTKETKSASPDFALALSRYSSFEDNSDAKGQNLNQYF